ncbi:DNA-binding GntR family transcriptional regulator [Kribbella steppae]|uniref:DNA-binding GntR family transcriptional regulator n=1 Tax=Kribbella steppae TaxID=2512223 RepID=A0A4R2HDV4_9ACTN|nr:GntR family transcriptional regulator [Kribbella steppae]TCO26509.1 DNA-binding GntR family transcriptional regulator [Kribbella steppae]
MSRSLESESERVTRLLRDEILDGVRAPGERLVERDVADGLGVSRVPVRDALKALVAEGLVTLRPRSWAVVREFTDSDIADLNEVRAAFEPLTFRLAAERRTREGLDRLRRALDEHLAAARANDAVLARRKAADFHEIVTELASNELLVEVERPLRSRMRWLLAQHDDLMAVADQHEGLYAAIANRDVAEAERLVAEHLALSHALQRHTRSS